MTSEKNDIQARKVTEKVSDTLSGFTSIFSGPISAVKDLARPAYWIPDEEIIKYAWQCTPFPIPSSLDISSLFLL